MKPLFIPIKNEYIRENLDWRAVSQHVGDMDFLLEYKDKIDWEVLSFNKYATEYLWKNQDKVCWDKLAKWNKDPKAMSLLKENLGKLITCSREDFLGLFANETKAAAELSKEVIQHYKPGGKFAFISNSRCMECRKVPNVNKCKVCVAKKWSYLSENKYMIPLIEDFIRSEEFKELYKDIEKCESNYNCEFSINCKYSNQIQFMRSLSRNSSLTPFLANKIIDFYWFIEDKVKETDLKNFVIAFLDCESKNKELFNLFCIFFDKTSDKSIISSIIHEIHCDWNNVSLRWGKEGTGKIIDICAKKAHLFIIDLNSYDNNEDLSESDHTYFWERIATMKNPKAIELIKNNIEYVNKLNSFDENNEIWWGLSENPYAISLINEFPQYVNYASILGNPNKEIVDFLIKNFEKIDWGDLGDLTYLIDLNYPDPPYYFGVHRWIFPEQNRMFESPNKRFSEYLVTNDLYQYEGIIVRRNLQNLYNRGVRHEKMEKFLFETNTIDYIRNNMDYFGINNCIADWNDCMIRAIFYKLDYENMSKNNADFSEELIAYVFNPDRVSRLSKIYNVDFIDIINSWCSD